MAGAMPNWDILRSKGIMQRPLANDLEVRRNKPRDMHIPLCTCVPQYGVNPG